MATVLITGGTGMIGKALSKALQEKNHEVIILTRSASRKKEGSLRYAHWDIENKSIDEQAVQQADYIIHLAGANVAEKRWTEARKKEILKSRTKSSALIVESLRRLPNKVQAVISASAIGWYGPDPLVPNPSPFVEEDPADHSFLGDTCRLWEESIQPVTALGKRLVILRTGIVLSSEGGAYKAFQQPTRLGVAPVMGDGRQVISWIHIQDLVQLYLRALEQQGMSGVYNAVAPQPVSNRALMQAITEKKFSLKIPVPPFALKIGLGEMSVEVLKSATVSAAKILREGFTFRFPNIGSAVQDLNKKAS